MVGLVFIFVNRNVTRQHEQRIDNYQDDDADIWKKGKEVHITY